MTIVITEKDLEAQCQTLLPDEEVLSAGLFQPYGSLTTEGAASGDGVGAARALHLPGAVGLVASAAVGLAAERGLAAAEHQPPWTALAVTAARVHAFDASAAGGLSVTKHFEGPPYASWNRSDISVHVSRHLTHFTMAIDDLASGTAWEYTGNQVYKSGGKLVAHLLTDTGA